nr:GIY-YIG nuclease family protein [[Eubacterium] tenue]
MKKVCSACKLIKDISEFGERKRKTNTGYRMEVLPICKSCNSYKAKLYYSLKKNVKITEKYYLYRFLDREENIIYIGKTSNLDRRIRNHLYGNGGLSDECYSRLSKIQVLEFESQTLRDINEIYYINIFKPPYNKEYNYDEDSVYIKGLGYEEWKDLDIESMFNFSDKDLKYMQEKRRSYCTQDDLEIEDNLKIEIDLSKLYIGKAVIFMRERNNKFIIYAEYFDSSKNKKRQVKLSEFDNKNIAICELENIKAKKKNGKYTIYLGGNIVI